MEIKDIVLALSPLKVADEGTAYALSLAARFGARVTAFAYSLEPPTPFSIFPQFTADLIQDHRSRTKAGAERVAKNFVDAAKQAGVTHHLNIEIATVQEAAAKFSRRIRTADLVVLAQHESGVEHYGDIFAVSALFDSGRPAILVPKANTAAFSANRILVAWDEGVHATRAVAASMPILQSSQEVSVLTVAEPTKDRNLSGTGLVEYLRLHGINASVCERVHEDVSQAILDEARLSRASLIVLGAYGHSRLREFVFGGVTRTLLKDSNVPLLMAH